MTDQGKSTYTDSMHGKQPVGKREVHLTGSAEPRLPKFLMIPERFHACEGQMSNHRSVSLSFHLSQRFSPSIRVLPG